MNTTTGTPLGGFEDRLLCELREIVAQRALQTPRARTGRLRMMATTTRQAPRRWAMVGVFAAGAIAVVLVLGTSGGGPTSAAAFTGWAATPTAPAVGQLRAAESACRKRNHALATLAPAVTDTRGPDSLLVYATRDATTTCVTGRGRLGTSILSRAAHDSAVSSSAIEPTSLGLQFAANGQAFRSMTGQVGADVTAVTVVLEDASTVQATVANGWFAAWWPVSQGFLSGQALSDALGASVPESFQVTTSTGTTAEPLTATEIQAAEHPPPTSLTTGSTGATSATGSTTTGPSGPTGSTAPAGIDPALWSAFAIFRQPGPNPTPLPAGLAGQYSGPAQPPNPYGINPNLAQFVAADDTWVLPGSSGGCLIAIGVVGPPPVGAGGCNSTSSALAGEMIESLGKWPTHTTWLIGLAPDGNPTVTVTDADGSTQQIPVTDNIYIIEGGNPTSITLHDSTGALTKIGIPSSGG